MPVRVRAACILCVPVRVRAACILGLEKYSSADQRAVAWYASGWPDRPEGDPWVVKSVSLITHPEQSSSPVVSASVPLRSPEEDSLLPLTGETWRRP